MGDTDGCFFPEAGPAGSQRLVSPQATRRIQLEILDYIHHFCSERGLRYSLYAGTLLGAVRHGGFIPWDDDIDLMMPRADYDEFCRALPREGDYHLAYPANEPSTPHAYAKVCHRETIVFEDIDVDTPSAGVAVDVIPYDVLPNSTLIYGLQRAFAQLARAALLMRIVRRRHDQSKTKQALLVLAKPPLSLIPISVIVGARTQIARLFSSKLTRHAGMLVTEVPWRVPLTWVEPLQPIAFEGRSLPGPACPALLLQEIYGDFATLPPVEERVSQHRRETFWVCKP